MRKFEEANVAIISFNNSDVIVTSTTNGSTGGGTDTGSGGIGSNDG